MWFRYFNISYIILLLNHGYVSKHFSSKFQSDKFRYRSSYRKNFKKNKGYTNYVEDHHVIPKQCKNHKLLQNINLY